MLKCREVVDNADLLLAGELPWRRRLAIRLHLLICSHCRRYIRQLRLLALAMRFRHRRASDAEIEKVMTRIADSEQKPPV